jgi:hypothetical protein
MKVLLWFVFVVGPKGDDKSAENPVFFHAWLDLQCPGYSMVLCAFLEFFLEQIELVASPMPPP